MGSTSGASGTRVVVIDDDDRTRTVIASWLGSLGYDVHSFTTADDAIEFVSREGADVVLTGSHVDGMSGARIAETIRGQASDRAPAFVALTPTSESPTVVEPGFDAVVRKPCSLDTLLQEISRLAPVAGSA